MADEKPANQVSLLDVQLMLGEKDIALLNSQKYIMQLEAELKNKQEVIDNLTATSELVNKED
jgi:hypothetical protein